MKKKPNNKRTDLYEIVLPFGNDDYADAGDQPLGTELFDDCPLCQQLKRDIAAGAVSAVPIQVEVEGGTALAFEATSPS